MNQWTGSQETHPKVTLEKSPLKIKRASQPTGSAEYAVGLGTGHTSSQLLILIFVRISKIYHKNDDSLKIVLKRWADLAPLKFGNYPWSLMS